MWTREELLEIRDRAELEVGGNERNLLWRDACVSLAASVDRLISLTDRICSGELTALSCGDGTPKLLSTTKTGARKRSPIALCPVNY